MKIAASDENNYDIALRTWKQLSEETRRRIGRVNVHGYGRNPGKPADRQSLRAALGDRPVWQSEYGEAAASGMEMAKNISADLHYLRPQAWVFWQPVEAAEWGLFDGEFDDESDHGEGRHRNEGLEVGRGDRGGIAWGSLRGSGRRCEH